MKLVFIGFIYLSLFCIRSRLEGDQQIKENTKNCRNRNRRITTDNGDLYDIIDVVVGQKSLVQCHYCEENDDKQPKIWYKIKNVNESTPQEVNLSMESTSALGRISINVDHTLIISNITESDSGLYYCMGLEGQESEYKYNYLLDLVFENSTEPESGNLTSWRKYHDENLSPINKLFASSNGQEYLYIREKLNKRVEAVTEWGHWEHCEICGRPQGEGTKRRKGLCRLKSSLLSDSKKLTGITPKNENETLFLNYYEISCRSLLFASLFPGISNITRFIPYFVQVEKCEGTCNPDAEGLSQGWKTGKTKGFKYRKSYVLAEDSHLTLVCPESTLENVVEWRKNGKVLKRGESVETENPDDEPRIIVDTFNTLYLHGVRSTEEGNYTCQVDDIRMQQVRVFIVSKSRLLTQAFVRHMMYLGFVLSLTMTCYCAGLVITCRKWSTFKGYDELKEENIDSDDDDEP